MQYDNIPTSERTQATADAMRRLVDRPEWLLAALRPERVFEALARHIPEVAAGDLRLIDCEAARLFLRNSRGRWRGIYSPEAIERIAAVVPDVAAAVQPLFERLQQRAASYPADPLVPSHGTFDSDQVLIAQERISFIDFDSFCMAEPALDVGHFRAAIMDSGMKLIDDETLHDPVARWAYLDRLNQLGAIFLAEYAARAPISRHRLALWEAWDYLRDSLHLWTKPMLSGAEAVVSILEYHLLHTGLLD